MYKINGQTVLEEEYDENYEPTEEGACYGFLNHCVSKVLFSYYQ